MISFLVGGGGSSGGGYALVYAWDVVCCEDGSDCDDGDPGVGTVLCFPEAVYPGREPVRDQGIVCGIRRVGLSL